MHSVFAAAPLQNFLHHCCWSKQRSDQPLTISLESQQQELEQLLTLLYSPRISFEIKTEQLGPSDNLYVQNQSYIEKMSIDLPGATPANARLDFSLTGDPIDYETWIKIRRNSEINTKPNSMRDMGIHWLSNSHCEWIPQKEGQGLRITGKFKLAPPKLASLPQTLNIRLKYSSPLTSLLQINSFIGGEQGLIFTVTANTGVIQIREPEAPSLSQATEHRLGAQQLSLFLQPEANK